MTIALAFDRVSASDIASDLDMAWATPNHKRGQVNKAGDILVDDDASEEELTRALGIINNWRASHGFPLNTLQVGLRDRATKVEPGALVAQRIKRLSSIESKLRRFKQMDLAQMQDIGGCRAVVRSTQAVSRIVALHKQSEMRHELIRENDYIAAPQSSGYRGHHLVYTYQSDKNDTYNGLRIEVQVRSQLQHAWATAVETVGTLLRQALKSSQGEDEWLRFFALMGSALAIREKTALVPGTPAVQGELVRELRAAAQSLNVETRLNTYGAAIQTLSLSPKGADFFLLKLEPASRTVTVTGYPRAHLAQATNDYLATEQQISSTPGADAVLVSVTTLSLLRRAYPNYFLDTTVFIEALKAAIG